MCAVTKALKFLETLVAPGKATESSGDQPKAFDTLLRTNVTTLTEALAKDSDAQSTLESYEVTDLISEDVRWTYSSWNLKLLRYLKESMQAAVEEFNQRTDLKSTKPSEHTAPPLSPDVLSFSQQKTVLSSLQFVAILGISSNLSPGIGLPVEKRSSFAAGIALKASIDTPLRFSRLKHCASSLISCVSLPSLGTLILSRHLGDIFAALAEIGYSPTGKYFDDRNQFRSQLDHLLNHVYLPVVVRELIVLQGAPQKKGVAQCLAPSPPWLRALCGHLLSRCVMKPNGVKLVLQGILNPTGDSSSPDWKRCDAAANVIAHCPRNLVSPEQYYSVISLQVIDLLQVEDKLVAKQFSRVAVTTIGAMATLHPEIAEKHVFRPLLHPLLCCSQNKADIPLNSSQSVIVCEKSLASCVESILKLMTLCDVPCSLLLEQLHPCFHLLFLLLCYTQNGVSHLRGPVEDIVKAYLRNCELKEAISSIQLMIYGHSSSEKDPHKLMHERLVFASGEGGGVVVLTGLSQSWLGDWETNAKHLVTLLRKTHRNELSAEFFLSLLQHLTKVISEATESSWMSTTEQVAMETIHRNLLTLTLLANMCEELGPTCLKSVSHILKFVQATLERAAYIMKNTTDEEFGIFETETITMAMILLTSVLEDPEQISKEDRVSTKSLLPFLDDIARCHHKKNIREMASDLSIAIATHGRLPSERLKEMAKFEKLAEELRDRDLIERDDDCSYIKAVEEVKDELVPVRGHGLIALKRLISSRDEITLQNAEALLEIFRENLGHEDTYVYLAAVQGLAVLADVLAERVLPIILEEYAETKKRKSEETRMKLGEVLVKTTKALGELTPHHRDLLLQSVLRVTRDPDDHVRASAVSNLGEICRLLRFSMGPVTHEVFECVSSLLKTDASADVRKSCSMVLTMLLQGLGDDALKVLDTVLLDLYRLLKQVMTVEKDEGVRLHAMLALAELDIIMKKFLFPEQSLSKHIHVLKPPVT